MPKRVGLSSLGAPQHSKEHLLSANSCRHTCCTSAERRAVDPEHVAAAERAVAAQPRRGARRRRLGRRRRPGSTQQPRRRAAPVAPPQVRASSMFWRLVVLDVPLPTRQSGAPPGSPTGLGFRGNPTIRHRLDGATSGSWCCGLTQGLSTQGVDVSCKCLATCRRQLSLVQKLTARSSIRCSDSIYHPKTSWLLPARSTGQTLLCQSLTVDAAALARAFGRYSRCWGGGLDWDVRTKRLPPLRSKCRGVTRTGARDHASARETAFHRSHEQTDLSTFLPARVSDCCCTVCRGLQLLGMVGGPRSGIRCRTSTDIHDNASVGP